MVQEARKSSGFEVSDRITLVWQATDDDTAAAVRFGHFPNITHVQALVARGLSRKGEGWFERRLGPGVTIEWFTYNAGPSAMEAIFAARRPLASASSS